jgi:hypothetical protein
VTLPSILITNVPAARLTVQEALIVARTRWQIELLFKLWKSHGQIDESRSDKPWRMLCEVYAKLLAMLVQHWILVVCCWCYPNRSLTKAAGYPLGDDSPIGVPSGLCAVRYRAVDCRARHHSGLFSDRMSHQ